ESHTAGRLDRSQSLGAVLTHPGHEHTDGGQPKFLRHGGKQHVHRWAMTVYRGTVGKHRHVAAWHAAHHHVAIARADQDTTRDQQIAGFRFLNFHGAALVKASRKHFRKPFGHVLHDKDAGREVRRNL